MRQQAGNDGADTSSFELVWYRVLRTPGGAPTLGEVLDAAPYLRDPGVDAELYRRLGEVPVSSIEAHLERDGWHTQRLFLRATANRDALTVSVADALLALGFHGPRLTAAPAASAAPLPVPSGSPMPVRGPDGRPTTALYYARSPERGLSLVLLLLPDDETLVGMAMRIYP